MVVQRKESQRRQQVHRSAGRGVDEGLAVQLERRAQVCMT